MGDETKETLIDQGKPNPLHATRKPSTAQKVEEEPAQVGQMPSAAEVQNRKDRAGKESR